MGLVAFIDVRVCYIDIHTKIYPYPRSIINVINKHPYIHAYMHIYINTL